MKDFLKAVGIIALVLSPIITGITVWCIWNFWAGLGVFFLNAIMLDGLSGILLMIIPIIPASMIPDFTPEQIAEAYSEQTNKRPTYKLVYHKDLLGYHCLKELAYPGRDILGNSDAVELYNAFSALSSSSPYNIEVVNIDKLIMEAFKGQEH